MEEFIELLVTAIPDIADYLWSQIEVLITAIPEGFGLPGSILGAIGFILIFGMDHLIGER